MATQTNSNPDNSSNDEEVSSQDLIAKGTVLGSNYEVVDIAGHGGMATVYKGIQKSLNRPVAIKVLHHRFVRDSTFIERFDKEADILASLSHPNVVSIIDKGSDNGRYFFVMEWLEGQTLDERIIAKEIQSDMWAGIIQSCSNAMTYVHNKGVVHRDLKPSNIMTGDDNNIKIGDFGIIHIVAGEKSVTGKMKKKKRSLGTELYMAPEQESDDESVDVRADVYSLAVTFFKMFTRRMPSQGGMTPSQHNSNVPVAVDHVIALAMSENRDDRYQTVEEFCSELLKALKRESTSITSVLGTTPSPRISRSLYTGSDFTPLPKKQTGAAGSKMTPLPIKKNGTQSGAGKPAANSASKKSSKMPFIIVGVVILLTILAGGTYGILLFLGVL